MHHASAYRFLGLLLTGLTGVSLFTSCTTHSVTALSSQSAPAVAKVSQVEPVGEMLSAVEGTETGVPAPAAVSVATAVPEAAPEPAEAISEKPSVTLAEGITAPVLDQANATAQEPSVAPAAEPVVLATVPRTPVSSRPTNQIMMVRTTAYSHVEADHLTYGRKSAAGTKLQYGSRVRSAAADWSKYPLGTRFTIEGLPYEYVVDDYGSALVGTETIDIYKPEMRTMNKWGVRNVPIKVLEWGSFEESRKILDGRKHVRHADHVRKMLSEIEKKGRAGYDSPVMGGSA